MNFELSEDQQALQLGLRRALDSRAPVSLMRKAFEAGRAGDADAWPVLVELGCLDLALSEADGGLGLGWLDLSLAAQEIGRALTPAAFSGTVVALRLLASRGDRTQRGRWLRSASTGAARGCVALIEGEDPFAPPRLRFEDGRLRGIKAAVAGGLNADFAIVSVRQDGDGPTLALVALDAPEIRREPAALFDATRGHAVLHFDGAPAERLGQGGAEAVAEALNASALLLAFEQLGGAERCLDMAVDYAKERRAFGRAIGSFQALKHKLVAIYGRVELARAHTQYAGWALDTGAPDLDLAVASARASATAAFSLAAQETMQVHGALGVAWAHDAHLFHRRARVTGLELGAAAVWKDRITDLLDQSTSKGAADGL